jgi:hypothetical protein
MMRPGHARSEAEVRYELITPLLRKVAHSVAIAGAPEGWEPGAVFSSVLNVERLTEERLNMRGAKPRVDYTLAGYIH